MDEEIEDDCNVFKPLYVDMVNESSESINIQLKFPCLFCEESFNCTRNLKQHTDSHKKNGLFPCPFCPRNFKLYLDIKKHFTIHDPDRKAFQCEICLKVFTSNGNLTSHMRRHNQEYSVECELCDKKFYKLSEKKLHVQEKHTGGLVCAQCGKRFTSATMFRMHKRIHAKPIKKKCHYCQEMFALDYMQCHLERCDRNTDKQTFICDLCGKTLNCIAHYRAHMQVHNGSLPFECDVCQKRFTQESALNVHKNTHLDGQRFQCRYCDKSYSRHFGARRHEVQKHPFESNSIKSE